MIYTRFCREFYKHYLIGFINIYPNSIEFNIDICLFDITMDKSENPITFSINCDYLDYKNIVGSIISPNYEPTHIQDQINAILQYTSQMYFDLSNKDITFKDIIEKFNINNVNNYDIYNDKSILDTDIVRSEIYKNNGNKFFNNKITCIGILAKLANDKIIFDILDDSELVLESGTLNSSIYILRSFYESNDYILIDLCNEIMNINIYKNNNLEIRKKVIIKDDNLYEFIINILYDITCEMFPLQKFIDKINQFNKFNKKNLDILLK